MDNPRPALSPGSTRTSAWWDDFDVDSRKCLPSGCPLRPWSQAHHSQTISSVLVSTSQSRSKPDETLRQIAGSYGDHANVCKRANFSLCNILMTFPKDSFSNSSIWSDALIAMISSCMAMPLGSSAEYIAETERWSIESVSSEAAN